MLFSGGKDSVADALPGAQGVRAGAGPVPDHARRHRAQLPRGDRVPRPHGRRAGRCGWRSPRSRSRSTPAGSRSATRWKAATATRPWRCWKGSQNGGFDAVFGGGRRDEDKARAKERVFSFRDKFGQWDPKNQRPELWHLYNGRHQKGEHIRVFPISDWTELDVWRYLAREQVDLPSIYFAHEREVVEVDGLLMAVNEFFTAARGRRP